MQYKPFNLKEALAGKPFGTKDGRKAIQYIYWGKGEFKFGLNVLTENSASIDFYTSQGICFDKGENNNLVMFCETKKGWVNLYKNKDGDIFFGSIIYPTADKARSEAPFESMCCFHATIEIEYPL